MNFVLVINEGGQGLAKLRDAEACKPYMGAWMAYAQALMAAGVLRGGTQLALPETATTVRLSEAGERTVHDGPYADTKEQLGGFFIIEAADLESALDWAAKAPLAPGGSVEVRPAAHPGG
jgi:hypothetical protein